MQAGVFTAFWHRGLLTYDAVGGIDWTGLALDGAMGKAPLDGGTGPNPTDPLRCEASSAGPSAG